MNAFVKKEIRLLLPNFGFACVLALAWVFFPDNPDSVLNGISYFLGSVFCPAVAVMLALSSFGVEVGSGTFSNLLAQPVSRQKIWEIKMGLLATAMFIVGLLWTVSYLFYAFHIHSQSVPDLLGLFSVVILIGLVIFSGGLWTVLLLRQVAAAFWFTLLVPGAIFVLLCALFDQRGDFFDGVVLTVMGLYSLAGFFFARWLFFRAQDLQWSGGNIVMPELRGLARFKAVGALRQWRPRAALWRKEFMLHQSQLVMAFALLVLHGGVLVARQFVDKHKSPEMYFVLEIFWGLWFVMPVLLGCAAVAEERKLGTHEPQLCLPVKRRTQFGIKLVVALGLSLLLGVCAPLLLEGTRILPNANFEFGSVNQLTSIQQNFFIALGMLNALLPLLVLVFVALAFCAVAFYVSTLSRNTLQSLAPAVLGIMAVWGLVVLAAVPWSAAFDFLWRGPLPFFIGVPVVGLTLLVLAAKNFRLARPTLRTGLMNLAVLVGAIVFSGVATSAIYHRCWEKLTPFEPAHGPARLSSKDDVRLSVWWAETSVRLTDGQIWYARFNETSVTPWSMLMGNFSASLTDGKFYGGSNWVDIRRYGGELFGTKIDGTLWISEVPIPASKNRRVASMADDAKMRNLVQFGGETNWICALPTYRSLLLVKNDGTLWRLGSDEESKKRDQWPGFRSFQPRQLGTDADWGSVTWGYYPITFAKTNGSLWTSESNSGETNGLKSVEIEPGYTVVQLYDGKRGRFRATTQIFHGLQYKIGIHEDGTFRIWANMQLNRKPNSRNYIYEFALADLPIGSGTNWVALAGSGDKVVTLKADGTLWLWDFHRPSYKRWDSGWLDEDIQKTVPTQLGKHSDWIAVSGHSGEIVALAADGSLWFWPVENIENYFNVHDDKPPIKPLLDISRKPQLLGNVFAQAK